MYQSRITRTGIAAIVLVLCLAPARTQSRSISVQVNGKTLQFRSVLPQVIEGRVMVPLRPVLERLGAKVSWDPEDRSLTAMRGDRDVYLPVGSRLAQVEGRPISLEAPARNVRGTIMVSLQFISESLGAHVTWDYKNQMVRISTLGRYL